MFRFPAPSHRVLPLLCVVLLLGATSLQAQPRPDRTDRSVFGHVRGGLGLVQGDAADVLDDGFSLGGGLTWWPESWPVGLVFDLDYADFDISGGTIRDLNDALTDLGIDGRIDGGDFTAWSLSTSVTWSPSSSGEGLYLVAGAGIHHLEGQLTENGLVYFPPICDPWLWWCVPGGIGEGSVVRASESATEFGYSAGLGWAFELSYTSQLFIEARYRVIETSPRRTELLPLSVGLRF